MTYGHGDDLYQYNGIELNFSSNIYSYADMSELKRHLCDNLDLIDHYPEPECRRLESQIEQHHALPEGSVLVTSGATEAIYLVAQALSATGCRHCDLGNEPTFREYEDACRMFGLSLSDSGTASEKTARWLCNPNNPTGTVVGNEKVKDLAKRYACVVVDQSYEGYTLQPMLSHGDAAALPNLLQIHSFTKEYAIPGLRIGYIVGNPIWIERLRGFLRPWSVNALAAEAALWLLQNPEVHAIPDKEAYLCEAQQLYKGLNAIEGITVTPTCANFMLAKVDGHTAAELKEHLAHKYRILIRDASNFRGLTPQHFRIAAQSPQADETLIQAIAGFMAGKD